MTHVVIVGGGISGLATAYYLHRLAPSFSISVLESNDRVGGVIGTVHEQGFTIENAADNFLTSSPEVIDLCQEIGLGHDLIQTNPMGRQALVLCRGRLQPIPPGFIIMAPSRIWPMVTTKILGPVGKLRAACELLIRPKATDHDESLESFVVRRFGRELFDRLVQPLVGGIYTADPRRLSLAATMPRFIQMEQEHGSLIRATWEQRRANQQHQKVSGARYSQFMTLKHGLSSIPERLAEKLPADCVQKNAKAISLQLDPNQGWNVRVSGDNAPWVHADALVLSTPAHASAALLDNIDRFLASDLSSIQYASCAVVSLGYEVAQIGVPLDSFGFVVPLCEGRMILSCSYSSVKYAGRAPTGKVLFRVFIGGACQAELLRLPEEQLIQLAEHELSGLLKITGSPTIRYIKTHWRSMPQYHVGHLARVAEIERRLSLLPNIAIAGSSLHGVGLPNCIKSARQAAEQIVAKLDCVHAPASAC